MFQEGKFYVCSPPGENWSDYEGPFTNLENGVEHLQKFVSEYTTPEMTGMVLVKFENNQLHLVKDADGCVINVALLRRRWVRY